jgi:hypothetical protein
MKKIYHLYNENFEITHAQFFIEGEQPENAVYIELNNFIKAMVNPETKEVYEGATAEEIAEANKAIVPQTISAMRLKLQLFDLGITDQDVFDDIDSIPESMFSTEDKEKAKIKYKTATQFERTNGELNFVATMEGLSQEQVDQIFINGNL